MKHSKTLKQRNWVDKNFREGEHGWKRTSQTHSAAKKYSRKGKQAAGTKIYQ